ncbi:hypothetical protein BB8028_0006g09770 [Beauveria bassiana]|uniref:Uncharacterized protein n=1 Tax=Beauveria bassiana TaxID=176275 RepID=A0A2S7YKH2_BEABA|nr:hypothetical protein BB8028_0006g09770 [Beauveria bassiana]
MITVPVMLRDHLARVLLQATAHTTHTTQLADPRGCKCHVSTFRRRPLCGCQSSTLLPSGPHGAFSHTSHTVDPRTPCTPLSTSYPSRTRSSTLALTERVRPLALPNTGLQPEWDKGTRSAAYGYSPQLQNDSSAGRRAPPGFHLDDSVLRLPAHNAPVSTDPAGNACNVM